MREKLFEVELAYIKNPAIKEFTIKVLNKLPEYFFTVPASSTGKYHPSFSVGEGGLVRHTKAAVRIATDILSLEMMQKYSEDEKDIIIASLILHDGAKCGIPGGRYSVTEHPLIMADFIEKNFADSLEKELFDRIIGCVRTHMGEFNKDYKTKREVLPKPKGKLQNIVHLADYLSSRKYFDTFDFNVMVKRDRNY